MFQKYNILLIVSDPVDVAIACRSLTSTVKGPLLVESVATLAEALSKVKNTEIDCDVLVSDLELKDSRGIDTLTTLRKHITEIPIIVLADCGSDELGLRAVSEGVQDFVLKSNLLSDDLFTKIRYAVGRQRSLNELRKTRDIMKRQAEFRSRFLSQMSHELRTPPKQRYRQY